MTTIKISELIEIFFLLKVKEMNLGTYTGIITALCFVPPILTCILGGLVWYCYRKSEAFILVMMKSVVTQMIIDGKPTYLVCGRKLPCPSRKYFMMYSLMILTICIQCFFLLVWFEVSYECKIDPDLDCFKEIQNIELSTDLFHELPVNCTSISKDVFVFCYRMTVFDPEKAFFSAAASYLLFEILNVVLVVVATLMLFLSQKFKFMLLIKLVITAIFLGLFVGFFILRTQVDAFESATRKVSYTVLVQGILFLVFVFLYVIMLPWGVLGKNKEYYGIASLPYVHDAHENKGAANENEMNDEKL
jgi:hypothetical protein